MAFTINHGHLSGYWNIDLADFMAADRVLRRDNEIVTYTETTKDTVVAYMRGVVGWGYSAAMDNRLGECAVGWREDTYKFVKTRVKTLTEMQVHTDTGALRAPVTLRLVYLRHRKTRRLVIMGVVHMVSSVETWMRNHRIFDIDRRVSEHRPNVWLDCARSLRRIIRNLTLWHPRAVIAIGGDWNLDHFKLWVRELTSQIGLRFEAGTFTEGTFHDRLIDCFRHKGCRPLGRTHVYPKFNGFDHKGWTQELTTT